MHLLHIETSTNICSVALSRGEELLQCIELSEGLNHTAMLAPMIDQLLKENEIIPSDLKAVSVSSGPGSYTGLRVGSSTAKAMAYSLSIPIIGVPTLLSLAYAASEHYPDMDYFLPMLDARRNEVYVTLFDKELKEVMPVSSLIVENEAVREMIRPGKIMACGDGAKKLEKLEVISGLRSDPAILCSARHLVKHAFQLFNSGDKSDPMHFVPFYMKPPNITQQRKAV